MTEPRTASAPAAGPEAANPPAAATPLAAALRAAAESALTAEVRAEIEAFDYPSEPWTAPHLDAAGERMLDVLVIGGGQAGISTAFRLLREGIPGILVVDSAPAGLEGPWITWARMKTLRTVKALHGTETGIRSASFRRWYDATRGDGAFDALELIPREAWMEYLVWLRDAARLPVRNDTKVTAVRPFGTAWEVDLAGPDGITTVTTRKIVACTGMAGGGGIAVPAFIESLDGGWAHSSHEVDWARLRGKRIAVLGLGASAFDNAAVALEQGAASVVQFGRRAALPTTNTFRYLEKKGLFRAYSAMPDDVRIGFSRHEFSMAVPPTAYSIQRCEAHDGYELALGVQLSAARREGDVVVLSEGDGPDAREWEVDFVIAGTGFAVDLGRVPWLAGVAEHIRTWGDEHPLGEGRVDRAIAAHPYLGAGMSCLPRGADSPEAVRNLHLFNLAAHVSYGISCIGLNGLPWSVANVVDAISADFVADDAARMLDGFRAYDTADTTTPGALAAATPQPDDEPGSSDEEVAR